MIAAQRGVSLVEAIVAMAVMAFGMVGMVGLQATLRSNADTSRQRAEALRLAQVQLEQNRNYSVITAAPGASAYNGIVAVPAVEVTGENTVFTFSQAVVDSATGTPTQPRTKTLNVEVSWPDRTGEVQRIRLSGLLTATPPALRGQLAIPADGSLAQRRQARNVHIPAVAVDRGDSSSEFRPPGAEPGVRWTFDNITGVITQICDAAGSCAPANARLLSGFIRFATQAPPVAGDGIDPPGDFIYGVGVGVGLTAPIGTPGPASCFTQEFPLAAYTAYYCVVPLIVSGTNQWSGRSTVTGLALAASVADPSLGLFRVCRYTALRSHATVPPLTNAQHPLDYADVKAPLSNQNFLVVKAGDGTVAFGCPEGLPLPLSSATPADPPPLGRTWHHQPPV